MIRAQALRMQQAIITVDRNGLLWLTEFRHPYLNRAMEIASRCGDWDVWTGLLGGMLLRGGRAREVAQRTLPRLLGCLGVCSLLKRTARRGRPSVAVEGFATLLTDPDPYSFPSSHSATSWAGMLAMARTLGGLGWLLVIPAVAISYSRMHVGAHYPLDVFIGTAIGVTAGLL